MATQKEVFWKDVVFDTDVSFPGLEGIIVPSGDIGDRPSVPANGTIRYNTNVAIQAIEVYQNATWETITTSAITGETNTASNIGVGIGIFKQKTGVDFEFKSLIAGSSNITIVSGVNSITLDAPGGEANTGSNVGTGAGVFNAKVSADLQFRRLNSLEPALTIVENGASIDVDVTFPTPGEINDGTNIGVAVGTRNIFTTKAGVNLQFKGIAVATTGPLNTTATTGTDIIIDVDNNPVFIGTESLTLPLGTTGQQPGSPAKGMIRYNSTLDVFEGYQGVAPAWETFATPVGTFVEVAGDTMTGTLIMSGTATIDLQGTGNLILSGTTNNIDMTGANNILLGSGKTIDGRDPSADGSVLDSINTGGNGYIVRTAASTYTNRVLTGTTSQITVTNGDGVAGNSVISIFNDPVFPGTVMTITTGTTAQRPGIPTIGDFRLNTDVNELEFFSGGVWKTVISSTGGTLTGNLTLTGANIVMSGTETVDGRDLSVDGAVIDQITGIASGFLARSSGNTVGRTLTPAAAPLNGIVITNGDGVAGNPTIGVNIKTLTALPTADDPIDEIMIYDGTADTNKRITLTALADFIGSQAGFDTVYVNVTGDTMTGNLNFTGGNITMSGTETVDGRDLSIDGAIIDAIDVAAEFGFVSRTADTPTYSRKIMALDSAANRAGLSITNGNGASGGNVLYGLDVTGLGALTGGIAPADAFVLYNDNLATNSKETVANLSTYLNDLLRGNYFRASSGAQALLAAPADQILAFTIGSGDFNPKSEFTDGTDTFTPSAGHYKIGASIIVDATTVAGIYTIKLLKNAGAVGTYAVVDADSTNEGSAQFEDIILANGTDDFTVQITNGSAMATAIKSAIFYAHRVF